MISKRDHLFISYATEDWPLAEWLTLHLTGNGYKVWCDRFKLLGGESYPKDIDIAIKNHTFRVIALMSKKSVNKDNPVKERTMALLVGNKLKIPDFLITINVDGMKPADLDWMTADISYIPFYKNWTYGFCQLLKKLESVSTPKQLENGKSIASQFFLDSNTMKYEPENVHSNCLQIEKIPKKIFKYSIGATTTRFALLDLSKRWAIYPKNTNEVFAFHEPPDDERENFKVSYVSTFDVNANDEIEGIKTKNIVKNLLKLSVNVALVQKSLQYHESKIYFPFGLLENDKIHFKTYTGKNTTVQVAGKRRWSRVGQQSELYHYHLSPIFSIRKSPKKDFLATLTMSLFLTNTKGEPIQKRPAIARSRFIRKTWYNHQWFSRYLGVISFFSDGQELIRIGEDNDQQIVLSSTLLNGTAPVSVLDQDEVDEEIDISTDDEIEEDVVDEEDFEDDD